MRRREFMAVLGGAAVWSMVASAQQPIPAIGFLSARSPDTSRPLMAAFHQGLAESGYADGRNVTIEYRWALGQYDRLPALARDLVGLRVAVIVAVTGEPAALAAKAATSTIPIVFSVGGDPVELGLVGSYERPGGNATGMTILSAQLEAKRLGLLRQLAPHATTLGVLLNPNFPPYESQLRDLQAAAAAIGVQLPVLRVSTDREIETAFETVAQRRIAALLQGDDPFLNSRNVQVAALAARYAVPTMSDFREYPTAGGLISYGVDLSDSYRQLGVYCGRILKGAKPADLPVVQPTKFELVINLKTAKALGLDISPNLLAQADEVIE
jgi:putative ABC transport system substrate-binding protein